MSGGRAFQIDTLPPRPPLSECNCKLRLHPLVILQTRSMCVQQAHAYELKTHRCSPLQGAEVCFRGMEVTWLTARTSCRVCRRGRASFRPGKVLQEYRSS